MVRKTTHRRAIRLQEGSQPDQGNKVPFPKTREAVEGKKREVASRGRRRAAQLLRRGRRRRASHTLARRDRGTGGRKRQPTAVGWAIAAVVGSAAVVGLLLWAQGPEARENTRRDLGVVFASAVINAAWNFIKNQKYVG